MIAIALLTVWAGYGVTSWGWCLVKGYNIPLGAWFSPVHPYQWPDGGQPQTVPKGQVFPGGDAARAPPAAELKPCPPGYIRGSDGKCYQVAYPVH